MGRCSRSLIFGITRFLVDVLLFETVLRRWDDIEAGRNVLLGGAELLQVVREAIHWDVVPGSVPIGVLASVENLGDGVLLLAFKPVVVLIFNMNNKLQNIFLHTLR